MPAPTIPATNFTNGSSAATNKVCNLPTNITSNSLLILVLRSAGADTHSTPANWVALALNNTADGSDDTTSVWYKFALGSEGSSVTVNGTASLKFSSVSWRVEDHDTRNPPTINTAVTGNSTVPDPGSISPPNAGTGKDFLYGSIACYEGEQTDPPSFPSDMPDGHVSSNSGTAGAVTTNCRANLAGNRTVNTVIGGSNAWLISVADDWVAWCICISPIPRNASMGWLGKGGWW